MPVGMLRDMISCTSGVVPGGVCDRSSVHCPGASTAHVGSVMPANDIARADARSTRRARADGGDVRPVPYASVMAAIDATDTAFSSTVSSLAELRNLYRSPSQLVVDKEQPALDAAS